MTTAVMPALLSLAEEYLDAWKRKDLQGISRLVHPEIDLKSPLVEVSGRDAFLGTCEKILPMLLDVRIHAKFASQTQAMMVYDFVLKEPIGTTRTANLMTFEKHLIRSVELLFDARPFEHPAPANR